MNAFQRKREQRIRRHVRVRENITGTPERPRLGVQRSLKHIYGMLVDDTAHRVLLTVSSLTPELRQKFAHGGNKTVAAAVGTLLAQRAKEKKITQVVFDRSGYKYHGRVKALADAARQGGLVF
jgi:large subunit ribosomal protein L18